MREYICFDPDWEALHTSRYDSEDDYFDALYDARDRADAEAREHAEITAELIEFDSDEERDAYIEEEYEAEYERLCREYEKAL